MSADFEATYAAMPAGLVSVACELTATMRPPSAIRGVSAAIVRTAARRFASSMRDQSSGDEPIVNAPARLTMP